MYVPVNTVPYVDGQCWFIIKQSNPFCHLTLKNPQGLVTCWEIIEGSKCFAQSLYSLCNCSGGSDDKSSRWQLFNHCLQLEKKTEGGIRLQRVNNKTFSFQPLNLFVRKSDLLIKSGTNLLKEKFLGIL